ncbi:MAG: dTMP kinase [Treponema sp. CETP13]|nr:MAG: dTMP kinase [Treponema sp. CETP13]
MILNNFIVLEGIDGAGTTTQLNLLKKRLTKKNAFFTAEPSKSETGKFLRSVLHGDIKLNPKTIAFLFATDRNEHLYGSIKNDNSKISKDCGIVERCNNGQLCITDRYLFSSLAYQSIECGKELPRKLNSDFPLPQIVFYFILPPSESLNRIKDRGVTEIYEKLEFLEKTAKEYEKIFYEYEKLDSKMKIVRIDATQEVDKIEKIIWRELSLLPILKE